MIHELHTKSGPDGDPGSPIPLHLIITPYGWMVRPSKSTPDAQNASFLDSESMHARVQFQENGYTAAVQQELAIGPRTEI